MAVPAPNYHLYEMNAKTDPLFYFDSLSGGDLTISMIKYQVTDDKGNVITKFMPGQKVYSPVILKRPLDALNKENLDRFMESVDGKLAKVRKNYSVSLNVVKVVGEGAAAVTTYTPQVWWNLYNALPVSVKSFYFSAATRKTVAAFQLTLQPDRIELAFAPPE